MHAYMPNGGELSEQETQVSLRNTRKRMLQGKRLPSV